MEKITELLRRNVWLTLVLLHMIETSSMSAGVKAALKVLLGLSSGSVYM